MRTATKAALGMLVAAGVLGAAELGARLLWGPPPPSPDLVPLSIARFVDEGDALRLSHSVDARQDVVAAKAKARPSRVIVLGGSSARHAWTVPPEQNFPTWLDRALPEVEVVNLASPGQQTGGLARLAGGLAPLAPDLVLVYAGHNDFSRVVFHGEVGAPRLALLPVLQALSASWIYTGLRRTARPLISMPAAERSPVLVTADDRALQQRQIALESYADGLRSIVSAAPAPVLLVTQLRNPDLPPTGVLTAPGSPCATAAAEVRRGAPPRGTGVRDRVSAACGPDAALTHWLTAHAEQDPAAWQRSLDRDPLPMRAPAAADAVVAAVADETGARFFDLATELGPMPPGAWFDDTLHPSPRGARVMGEALAPVVEAALAE